MKRRTKLGLNLVVLCLLAAPAQARRVGMRPPHATQLQNCAWRASQGARVVTHAGRTDLLVELLPHPEPRTIECWVPLPGDQEMVARGSNVGAVTESGWTFSFVRFTGERITLNRSSQEREFSFPVPLSWEHDKRVGIMLGIPGDNPGYVQFADLRLAPAPNALPAAPHLVSPKDGQQLTPPAADFLWSNPNPELVSSYQVDWHRKGGKVHTQSVPAYFISNAQGFWPTRWIAPGEYTWKVRALNAGGSPGGWSATMHFTVRAESAKKPPDIRPSEQHPLFLVDLETSNPGPKWKLLPPDVQGRLLFRVGGSLDHDQHTLEEAQRQHIPIVLQVNGPHNIIAGRWDRLPLARLAEWAHQYSELKAFYICEQQVHGGVENPEVKSYIERLIALGSEKGRPLLWADANWGRNIWLDVEAQPDFTRFLRSHYGYLYPLWKMNGGEAPYLAPAGLLGLWLTRTVAAWGVQPETWYWVEAGFTALGIQHGYKEGVRQDAPPVLFQELALLGASAGAQVYSFEPGTDIFDSNSGRNLQMILVPLVRLLSASVIPNRTQVKAAVVKAHLLEPHDLAFRQLYTAQLRKLFAKTLGIEYPFQMVPESGSCYWIPFVPPSAKAALGRINVSSDSSKQVQACHPPVPGKAAVFKAGNAAFIFNSRLNWSGEEGFSLDVARVQMVGTVGVNGWVVVRNEERGGARLWFFARRGARLDLKFDRPVVWKTLGETHRPKTPNPPQSVALSNSRTWSRAVTRINLQAGQHPWDIEIRPGKGP